MKHLIPALAASAILITSGMAQKIGVTLSAFEHQFLVNVREAMTEKAKEMDDPCVEEDGHIQIALLISASASVVASMPGR